VKCILQSIFFFRSGCKNKITVAFRCSFKKATCFLIISCTAIQVILTDTISKGFAYPAGTLFIHPDSRTCMASCINPTFENIIAASIISKSSSPKNFVISVTFPASFHQLYQRGISVLIRKDIVLFSALKVFWCPGHFHRHILQANNERLSSDHFDLIHMLFSKYRPASL